MATTRLDFVVFGATGFTGKHVLKSIWNIKQKIHPSLTWGIAGRNKERLEKVLGDFEKANNISPTNAPIIIADVKNEESLNAMAAQARVILNCCGPFRFFGEPVVKACVANATHHVDVSGEPQYMEQVQLKYHDEATKQGIYIVSACGFDSIPTDLGIVFLEKEFKGQVNSVETYLEAEVVGNISQKSSSIHYGTWESAVQGMAHAGELGPLRRKLYPERLPPLNPRLAARSTLHKSDVINKWCLPFPGSDRAVVQRSQRALLELERKRPVQIYTYVAFPSLVTALMVTMVGAVFGLFSSFSFGRSLLLRFPRFFSLGFISHEGPTEELAEATHFSVTIVGNGWSDKQAEPLDNPQSPPDKTMVVKVSGVNPGYGATANMLALSALTILRESSAMPGKGGVLSPGVAFAKTTLLNVLPSFGIKFQLMDSINVGKPWFSDYLGAWIQDLINSGIY